ncbi:tripartite tricarboxylate transporter substrate-binding protein, partial [Roseomonas sp. DSM 102946]|nr:tripartite tricarboxylate transporter substrate-binding protein [Roseomonas sp. DSM 102946]
MPCLFRRTILTASSAGLLAAVPGAARAQEGWPKAKPVRVIIPYSPASAPDNVFRLYAEGLTTRLGASFVVENRSGGAGMIGTEAAARAVPDGYTLLVSINAPISVNRHLYT